jgi:flagella basal body P-ring formation protein FlgA
VTLDNGTNAGAAQVRAGVLDTLPLAARDLATGDTIGAADIALTEQIRWGTGTSELASEGWVARRPIPRGTVLARPAVAPPLAIRAGDTVRLEWTGSVVAVAIEGRAINAARVGEQVRVRVEGRKSPVVATVLEAGRAALNATTEEKK